jgi:hypothetical protein
MKNPTVGVSNLLSENEFVYEEHYDDMITMMMSEVAAIQIVEAINEGIANNDIEYAPSSTKLENMDEFSIFDQIDQLSESVVSPPPYIHIESEEYQRLVLSIFESLKRMENYSNLQEASNVCMLELGQLVKEGVGARASAIKNQIRKKFFETIKKLMDKRTSFLEKQRELTAQKVKDPLSVTPAQWGEVKTQIAKIDILIDKWKKRAAEALRRAEGGAAPMMA